MGYFFNSNSENEAVYYEHPNGIKVEYKDFKTTGIIEYRGSKFQLGKGIPSVQDLVLSISSEFDSQYEKFELFICKEIKEQRVVLMNQIGFEIELYTFDVVEKFRLIKPLID